MKSVLFEMQQTPSLLMCLLLVSVVALGVGLWLVWLRGRKAYTRDHLYTGLTVVALATIILVVLNRIGHLRINAYGTMLMLGFVAGAITAIRLGRRRGIVADHILNLGLCVLVGAILGARIAYVLITPNAGPLFDLQQIATSGLGGLSFHGGLIGGVLTGSIYIMFNKLAFWRVADCCAPAIAVGYAITRIGCFLNGCCYGKPSSASWAMIFPDAPDTFIRHTHVHPTQLYASLMGFAMYGILLLLARGDGLRRAGRLFMALLMLEGVERFVMEIFRYPDPNFHGTVTLAQFVSMVIFLVGIVGIFLLPKRPAVTDPTPAPVPATPA